MTITLKPYMWSNGTPVTAQDVMFWLNMEPPSRQTMARTPDFPANVIGH